MPDTLTQPTPATPNHLRSAVLILLILVVAFSRIIPHMPNFSPLGAISLFSAAFFYKKWQAFLMPLVAAWLSDLFINNVIYGQYYPEFTWLEEGFYWQYGCYVLITFAGIFILKKISLQRIVIAALCSAAIFFLVSNLSCLSSYPATFDGLIDCYSAGIPYLKGTLLGDLFYAAILFGSFAMLQKQFPVLQSIKQQA